MRLMNGSVAQTANTSPVWMNMTARRPFIFHP